VKKDMTQAFHWFAQAADKGVPAAQSRLGLMYASGEAVALDPIEAHKWFILAANAGDVAGKANCEHSEAELDVRRVTEAQRRANAFTQTRSS
jgi:TPR repeat protein